MATRKGLGRGLGALLMGSETEYNISTKEKNEEKDNTQEISIFNIIPNENQPRKRFDEVSLSELANSIRIHGVISPIIVVKKNDKYMIIAGERRWRASKRAGLMTIPAIIRDYTEQQIKEISLIENLQREDLNPIDTAKAIKELMDDYKYTQEEVAERIGKSRPAVTNTLRLLQLSPAVMDMVSNGSLSAGHARCLVVINDSDSQLQIAKQVENNKVTVRECEKIVKNFLNPKKNNPKPVQSKIGRAHV